MAALLQAIPADLEPWLGWLLVALCRQRARQTWLVQINEQRLADLDDDDGDVPGIAGWRYQRHGMGLCLYGPNGEALDMDFHDDAGRTIDPYFFAHRVLRLEVPEPIEATLIAWLPTDDLIVAALDAARERGLIVPPKEHVFRLADPLEAQHETIAAADVAACREAWPGTPGEGAHRAWLLSLIAARERSGVMEAAVRLLPEDVAIDALVRVLDGPIDSATGGALQALAAFASPPTAPVVKLLARFDPSRDHPFSATEAAGFLLRRGVERERALDVVFRFAAVDVVAGYRGNPFLSELATLVLEFAPAAALPLVRRALRSNTPINVGHMAALLASIDRMWCHRELHAALAPDEQPDVSNRRLLAAALGRCDSELARRRSTDAMPAAPERAPDAIGYTWEEVAYASLDDDLGYYLGEAEPIAARLRDVEPGP